MSQMLFIGGIGSTELILVIVVLLLVFGGKKLPELMRGAGRGIREFKDAMNDVTKDTIQEAKDAAQKPEQDSSTTAQDNK